MLREHHLFSPRFDKMEEPAAAPAGRARSATAACDGAPAASESGTPRRVGGFQDDFDLRPAGLARLEPRLPRRKDALGDGAAAPADVEGAARLVCLTCTNRASLAVRALP